MAGIRLLLRRDYRELKTLRFRAAAIGLIAASGMAIFTGMYSAIDSLFRTRDFYYREGGMADLEIRFIPEDRANLPRFDDLPGLAAVESRLLLPGHLELADGHRLSATLVGLDLASPPELDRLTILEGRPLDPARPKEVVLDRHLAHLHGFAVGDRIRLTIGKDHYDDLVVGGVALSPEYLIASADPSVFLPSKGSLGVVFAPLELLEERLGFPLVNSLLVSFRPGADAPWLESAAAERADEKLAVEEVTPRRHHFSTLFLDTDLNAFAVFVPAIILIFTLTAVVVTQFLLFQWIAAGRRQIGLLMALGYDRKRLAVAHLVPVAVLAALAAAAGYGLSFVTLYGFGESYAEAIGMPPPRLGIGAPWLAGGLGGIVLALGAASVWPQARLLKLTPQDAVRGEPSRRRPALGGFVRRLAARIRGRLALRYALRNVLRGRVTSVMTVVSVAMALGVAISYFIAMTSFERSLVRSFQDDRWDAAADFLAPVWDDELTVLDGVAGVSEVEPYLRGAVRLLGGARTRSSLVTGIDPESSLRRVAVVEGRGLRAGDEDVFLLERQAAQELGFKLGDTVAVESRGKRFEARLVGLFSGVLPAETYAPRGTVRRWLDLDEQSTGVFLRAVGEPAALVAPLFEIDRVGRVTLKSQLVRDLLKIVDEIFVILYIAEAFSIAVAVLFVFSIASFLVLERRSEYDMLRILGFRDRTVGGIILGEIVLLGLLGAALAVPLGYGLAVFLTARMSAAWFTVDVTVAWRDVLVIVIPALLVLPLAAWPAIREIRSSSLTKTLRERMFG